jgi:hypothetical protein
VPHREHVSQPRVVVLKALLAKMAVGTVSLGGGL